MSFFAKLQKAMKFTEVISYAAMSMADGKYTPQEIANTIDKGLDAAGIEGIDHNDVMIEPREGGGFAIVCSKELADKMTVEFD